MANIVAKYIMEKIEARQKASDIWAEALKITDLESALYEIHSGKACQGIQDEMYARSGKVREEIASMDDKKKIAIQKQISKLTKKAYDEKGDKMHYSTDIRRASRYIDIVFGEQMDMR